jgi:Na+/proline symporter
VLWLDAPLGLPAALASLAPERLDWSGGQSLAANAERWAIPVVGSLVAQELISRVSAARSARVARGATLAAAGLYLTIGLIPALIGLAGPALLPGLADSEQLLPRLAVLHLPPLLGVLFLGAIVSAILSTVDSALLAAASLLAHNLAAPLRPGLTEAGKLRVARAGVVLCGVVAWGFARSADSVYELVEGSSAFGSAGIVVALFFGLFTRAGGPRAAAAALATGALVWSAGPRLLALETPYLGSLACATVAYLAVAALERSRGFRSP